MNNRLYIFLIFSFLLLTFSFITGCGKYATQYSAPVIISRYPPLGSGPMATNEVLWVKFSKKMNENNWTGSTEVMQRIYPATNSTATMETLSDVTVEALWSEDNTKLSVYNIFFTGEASNYMVHLLASREAFSDVNGLFLPENTTMWSYTIEVP